MKRPFLLTLIYSLPIIIISILYLALSYAPIFVSYLIGRSITPYLTLPSHTNYSSALILGIVFTVILYILTEQSATHHAAEFENRFWTVMAFNLAVACSFAPDSPIRLDNSTIAWVFIIAFTFSVHNYDRHLRRIFLQQIPNIKRISSANFPIEHRTHAKEKAQEIRRLLRSIDLIFFSSALQNLFFLPRVLFIEHSIIKLFENTSTEELNLILNSIELGLLFYKIKDHRIARRFHRTKILEMLARDRLLELNITSRAILLDGKGF